MRLAVCPQQAVALQSRVCASTSRPACAAHSQIPVGGTQLSSRARRAVVAARKPAALHRQVAARGVPGWWQGCGREDFIRLQSRGQTLRASAKGKKQGEDGRGRSSSEESPDRDSDDYFPSPDEVRQLLARTLQLVRWFHIKMPSWCGVTRRIRSLFGSRLPLEGKAAQTTWMRMAWTTTSQTGSATSRSGEQWLHGPRRPRSRLTEHPRIGEYAALRRAARRGGAFAHAAPFHFSAPILLCSPGSCSRTPASSRLD